MKKIILFLSIIISSHQLFADQLAYLSKQEAEKAVAYLLKHKKVINFCGCCNEAIPLKVKVINAEARYTNYENYYEVYITYKDKNNQSKSIPVDLAYLWTKYKGNVVTIGEVLHLEHDPCVDTINWKI
jgi:hypothetical protein